jgi:hypothetical protein
MSNLLVFRPWHRDALAQSSPKRGAAAGGARRTARMILAGPRTAIDTQSMCARVDLATLVGMSRRRPVTLTEI